MTAAARVDFVVPVLLGAVVVAVALSTMGSWPVGVFLDDGVYVTLAKSLATGEGYRYLNLPGSPAATHYPPGYPAFLAVLWRLFPQFPENVVVFKTANALLLASIAVGGYYFGLVRLRLPRLASAFVALAFTVPIPILWLVGLLLSETLFLAMLLPTLLLAERLADRGGTRLAVAVGVLFGALILVRTLGIALVPAAMLVLGWRRRWKEAAIIAVAAIVIYLPWQLWVGAHADDIPAVLRGTYGSYTAWLAAGYRDMGLDFGLAVIALNLKELGEATGGYFSLSAARPVLWLVRLAMVVGLAAGLWGLRRLAPVTSWFILGYLAIVLVWPFRPTRFVEGIWVLVGLTLAVATRDLWMLRAASPPLRVARGLGLACAALMTVGYVAYNARWYPQRGWERYERETSEAAAPLLRWIMTHTAPSDIVASDGGALIYLYTGRQTVPLGEFTAAEYVKPGDLAQAIRSLRSVLDAYPIRYVMVTGGSSAKAAEKLLYATPPVLAFVDTLPKGGAVLTPHR